ncbi:MAG TPA: acetyl-CoA carboxylase biotin carboxyl carrier protein [Sumerlaeia bacterium]|nr:acetyl-CoA carboxylase biotin carboxyl carrier protein [Sumerlaeia bacterium]
MGTHTMNLDEIRELISLMRENQVREIDLEQGNSKVRIVVGGGTSFPAPAHDAGAAPLSPSTPVVVGDGGGASVPAAETAAVSHGRPTGESPLPEGGDGVRIEVKSPMVGTLYRAPAPDAPSYVEVGSVVNAETVLCIIEAMKLMNEIKSEMRGRILEILVENGQPVEFNQPLFVVEPL